MYSIFYKAGYTVKRSKKKGGGEGGLAMHFFASWLDGKVLSSPPLPYQGYIRKQRQGERYKVENGGKKKDRVVRIRENDEREREKDC